MKSVGDTQPERDLKLKVRLVFWQHFHTEVDYNFELHSKISAELKAEGYNVDEFGDDGKPRYKYIHPDGHEEDVGWLAQSAAQYMPLVFHIADYRFTTPGGLKGKVRIEGHLHYGGCLLFSCIFDYEELHRVEDYVRNSQPKDIKLLEADMTLWSFFEKHVEDVREALCKAVGQTVLLEMKEIGRLDDRDKKSSMDMPHPWHHTWIILGTEDATEEDLKNDLWQSQFDVGGTRFKHALGLAQRADNWYDMATDFFAGQMTNHTPYENSCVYITNAGNVIVANRALQDENTIKNKLIDVIFATEMGNVQRFLSLVHVTAISEKVARLQEDVERMRRREKVNTKRLANDVRELEVELNRIALEVNDDLMITRVRRLMFTSILKLTLFQEMIRQLHGYEYREGLNDILVQMQETVARERVNLENHQAERENALLKNLQIVFIISLGAEVISLFFYDPASTAIEWGYFLFTVALLLSIFVFVLIQYGPTIFARLRR